MHQSQVNICLLRGPLRWLMEQKNPKFLQSLQNAQRDTTNLAISDNLINFGKFEMYLHQQLINLLTKYWHLNMQWSLCWYNKLDVSVHCVAQDNTPGMGVPKNSQCHNHQQQPGTTKHYTS